MTFQVIVVCYSIVFWWITDILFVISVPILEITSIIILILFSFLIMLYACWHISCQLIPTNRNSQVMKWIISGAWFFAVTSDCQSENRQRWRRDVHGDMLALWQRGLWPKGCFYPMFLWIWATRKLSVWAYSQTGTLYLKWWKSILRDNGNTITQSRRGSHHLVTYDDK